MDPIKPNKIWKDMQGAGTPVTTPIVILHPKMIIKHGITLQQLQEMADSTPLVVWVRKYIDRDHPDDYKVLPTKKKGRKK